MAVNWDRPLERKQLTLDSKKDRSWCNISNTRDSVSSGYPNTEKRVENATRGVWIAHKLNTVSSL